MKSATLAAINELTSPQGTTNITQGLGWSWRVVKPEAPFTEADPNPDGPRQQAIVLLTDGKETCGGSPCQLAGTLAAEAHDLTVHVIGFKVRDDHFGWDADQ